MTSTGAVPPQVVEDPIDADDRLAGTRARWHVTHEGAAASVIEVAATGRTWGSSLYICTCPDRAPLNICPHVSAVLAWKGRR